MRKKLGLALAVLVVLAVVADVLVERVYLADYWRPVPPFGALTNERQRAWLERQRRELAGEPATGTGVFDAELGWSNRAGSASANGRMSFGSRGARGPREYARETPPGTTRVAAFGDSFTLCDEVPDDATWEVLLEGLDPGLEVPNLGVGGYGTDQALLRARRELGALDADVALLGILLENIGRNVNRYRPRWYPLSDTPVAKPRFVLRDGRLELVPLPFASRGELVRAVADASVLERLAEHEYWDRAYVPPLLARSAIARLLGARRAYAERDLLPLWTETDGEPFRVTLALLEEFVRLAREEGVRRAAILVFAMELDLRRWERDGTRYWTTLLEALEARGIPYVDLTAAVGEAYHAGNDPPLFLHSHHSRAGNMIVAVAVRDWLRATDATEEGGNAMNELLLAAHPTLVVSAFETSFAEPLGGTPSPSWLTALLRPGAEAPLRRAEEVRQAVRDLLRVGGYKPTGRGKPASEYLVRVVEAQKLGSINVAVDACNAVSYHSGLPISVVDLERATPPFRVATAAPGSSYVFNASGQVIDLGGLLCLFDAEGPCANAVKDAQRTKTGPGTRRTLSVVWAARGLEARLERASTWYRELLEAAGAMTAAVPTAVD